MDSLMTTQNKVQKIVMNDTRVATDLKNKDSNVSIDKDFYSVEATKTENAFIDEVLNSDKYMGQINDMDRISLEVVRSRNDSHILVNDHKWYAGDSDLMNRVKDTVTELEKSLAGRFISEDTIENTRQKYKDAITACENYVAAKNPWFSAGKRRKREVEERLKKLREERDRFEWGVSAIEKGLMVEGQPAEMMSYLNYGHEQMIKAESYGARYKAHFNDSVAEAHAVSNMVFIKKDPAFVGRDVDFDFTDKKLSEKAQKFFDDFFKSKDVVESMMTNEVNDRWAEVGGLQEKNLYMNDQMGFQVGEIYRLMDTTNNKNYVDNKEVVDKLFKRFEEEMRAIDAISYTVPLLGTKKNEITDDKVRAEVTEKLDYYYELQQRTTRSASRHAYVIKAILEGTALESGDIEHTDMEDDLTLREKTGMGFDRS